jgi:sugar transferase (PEP-CTERM/EpsH1 system associated)
LRILWLKTELLHPVDKGGKIRTYHMLKALKRQHHVTYLTLDDGLAAPDAQERAAEYCHELVSIPHQARAKFSAGFYGDLALNLVSRLPYALAKYKSDKMRRAIIEQTERNSFDVVICDFLTPSVNLPSRLGCATVLFQHNVEAAIWRRHYEVQAHPLKKVYLYDQWRKMWRFERASCLQFDQVIAVSREDREEMRRAYGVEAVADVPTGVDVDYFSPRGGVQQEAARLVFTGSMDWLPNEDAIQYFTDQVLPLVKRRVPGVTLTVVGRNPSPRLLELSKRDPAIIVTGRVEDVRPYIESATAFIVPIRVGGGTRLKIYEAMAMEKAVISTTIGAEGLPVRDGIELLLADTSQTFADAVVRVLTEPALATRIGLQAANTVRERFGWEGVAESFVQLCQRAIEQRAASVKAGLSEGLPAVNPT